MTKIGTNNMTTTKVKPCASCGEPLEYTHGNQRYHSKCLREKNRLNSAAWYAANKDHAADYYQKTRGVRLEQSKKAGQRFREANPYYSKMLYHTKYKPQGIRLHRHLDRLFRNTPSDKRPELARKVLFEWKPKGFSGALVYVTRASSLDRDWLWLAEE